MTLEQKSLLLEKLSQDKKLAFAGAIPNAPAVSEIVSQLNSIPQEDKHYFKDFAVALKLDLFVKGVVIKSLNIELFEPGTGTSSKEVKNEAEVSRYSDVQTELKELLKKLVQNHTDHFEILKGYFIARLENAPLESYKLYVLHDSTYFIQPIKKKFSTTIPDAVFNRIEEFRGELEKGNFPKENILCLILLLPRTNNEPGMLKLKEDLSFIVNSYKSFESYSLRGKSEIESSINKEDFFEEIEFVNGTLLSNGSIKHEEEKIIKKLFRNFVTPLLIYKMLTGGNSGTKVVEVRPKKELGNEYEKRYIIKYSEKNDERKIDHERKCFGKWIAGYKGFKDYECEYDKTLTHEGLRYSYAISDSATESYSYSEILQDKSNGFHADKISIVDNLFEIDLYKLWRDSLEASECTTSELYESYLKVEKTFQIIGDILNLNSEQVKQSELYVKIWNSKLTFNKKVCHGDLHTENFFKDKNGVYLIDFGYTGIRHALIDHTTLECSIKFKHIQPYIEIQELIDVENELLLDTSFQLSARFSKTTRPDLLEKLEIIKRIRSNSLSLILESNSITEYLISLFIVTFRQIRYSDLNQRYAYNSALAISRKLIQLLG